MHWGVLADLVVLLHLAFIAFAVLGGLLAARWPRVAWLHLPAVAWAAAVELAGWTCPLTPLEWRLRERAGEPAAKVGFVDRHLLPALYPASLTRPVQIGLGAGVLLVNAAAYAWVLTRSRVRPGGAPPRPGARARGPRPEARRRSARRRRPPAGAGTRRGAPPPLP